MVIALSLLVAGSLSYAAEMKAAPAIHMSKMPMEHVGMDCTNCHGPNGPKGMGNHPAQKCTDCHKIDNTPGTPVKPREKTNIAKEMMLKHAATINCRTCHGEKGPKNMPMEHIGMDCTNCHRFDGK